MGNLKRMLTKARRLKSWQPTATAERQWLKWFCEAGGSPDEARLEQTPYPFHTN